ncbi:hypothetical protein PR048_000278 [Dryococelus australis]|uniref:Uncharacterized protein n=1 Tax=Dryococelus australis TaxID=614101 RepID=A0ABQ9IFH4_9NEOP|nr:hypothetical protein PR048_000278 [Dryococelus australis]
MVAGNSICGHTRQQYGETSFTSYLLETNSPEGNPTNKGNSITCNSQSDYRPVFHSFALATNDRVRLRQRNPRTISLLCLYLFCDQGVEHPIKKHNVPITKLQDAVCSIDYCHWQTTCVARHEDTLRPIGMSQRFSNQSPVELSHRHAQANFEPKPTYCTWEHARNTVPPGLRYNWLLTGTAENEKKDETRKCIRQWRPALHLGLRKLRREEELEREWEAFAWSDFAKPKSGWPDRESNPGPPEFESSELPLRHLTLLRVLYVHGAVVVGRLDCLLPTKANKAQTPGRVIPRFSQVETVPDDAAGQWVFSGICSFPLPCISALLHSHIISPSSALKTSLLRATQISQVNS